eukprot:196760_1
MALHRNLRYLVANPILNCEDFVQMNRPVIFTMFLVIFLYQVSCANTNRQYSVNEASDANQGDGELISGYIRENYENPQRSFVPDYLKKLVGKYYKYVPLKDKIILSMSTKTPLKQEFISDLNELFNAKRSEETLTLNLDYDFFEDDYIDENDVDVAFDFSWSFSFEAKIFTHDETTEIMFTLLDLSQTYKNYTADEIIYLIAESRNRST